MPTPGTGRPRGRPPKPLEQKRALGLLKTPAPLPGVALVAATDLPNPPTLKAPGAALWAEVWLAGRAWLSPESDYTLIKMLCEAHDEHEEIRQLLISGKVARYYETNNGQIVTHPLVTQLANLRQQLTAWLAAIGFSPADRSRLGLAEVRVRDELDELDRRRAERSKPK